MLRDEIPYLVGIAQRGDDGSGTRGFDYIMSNGNRSKQRDEEWEYEDPDDYDSEIESKIY